MKTVLLCVGSALLGAVLVATSGDRSAGPVAFAQARRPAAAPAKAATPPRLTPPAPPAEENLDLFPPPRDEGAPGAAYDEAIEELTPEERVNIAVYERVNKSVVHITTKGVKADAVFLLDLPTEGAGSGSVLDYEGHVLTNYHVIEEARQVQVTLVDGSTLDAKFVGADPVNDVAVIKLDAPREALHPVTLADSRKLKVGMRVYALGNPFGLERTLTTGIISSLNRSLPLYGNRTIKQIIQIDAAINPGNSGGPLLDTRGRLIGMNTAIASKTGQSSGVGFAIPSNLISRIVPQLIANGKVTRPEVGITRVYETDHGLLVARLVEGGPAEKAGLRGPAVTTRRRGPFSVEQIDRSAADLIVEVDGEKVQTADDFLGHIESREPGDTVTLTVVRGGREIQVPIRLSSSDDPPAPKR
jgi:S1-C subfamily serine protease